jgi:formylglycine-generating enzyme required for sulfatase activity
LEWTRSLYVKYPYYADDGREDVHADGTRVVRGGAFHSYGSSVRGASRSPDNPFYWNNLFGFRVCVSPFSL